MTFITQPTFDGGHLVKGTDTEGTSGQTILYSEKWNAVLALRNHAIDESEFTDVVHQLYRPLMDKADEIRARRLNPFDGLTKVVVTEGSEGVDEVGIDLAGDNAGIVLNLIDQGKSDLLRWVNGGLTAVNA